MLLLDSLFFDLFSMGEGEEVDFVFLVGLLEEVLSVELLLALLPIFALQLLLHLQQELNLLLPLQQQLILDVREQLLVSGTLVPELPLLALGLVVHLQHLVLQHLPVVRIVVKTDPLPKLEYLAPLEQPRKPWHRNPIRKIDLVDLSRVQPGVLADALLGVRVRRTDVVPPLHRAEPRHGCARLDLGEVGFGSADGVVVAGGPLRWHIDPREVVSSHSILFVVEDGGGVVGGTVHGLSILEAISAQVLED
mmetsp:Transcript_10760/g.10879  ORF Transcript_10760/g.10879 Transcript_10760/m.10879 type:complete len:250 (-) Transcript_10760:751-1500(-)